MHHKNSVIVNNTDYHMGNTQGLVLTYDSCNLDDCTYWEIDWGGGTFEAHFSNCSLPANLAIDIIDVARYKISFTGCNLYDPNINLQGPITASSELSVTNCNIYQRGSTTNAGFYFGPATINVDETVNFSNCIMDCEALLYHADNTPRYFDVNFSNCYGNCGTNDIDAGGTNITYRTLTMSNCHFDDTYNALSFKIKGVQDLELSSCYIRADEAFTDINNFRVSASYLYASFGELIDNPNQTCNFWMSSTYFYGASGVNLIRTDETVQIDISASELDHHTFFGDIVQRIAPLGASQTIDMRISGSFMQNMRIQQTKGTLNVWANGNEFYTSYIRTYGTGTGITLKVVATGNFIYIPIPPGTTYLYFVTVDHDGTPLHNTATEITLDGNNLYCLVGTATCLGGGYVGLHGNVNPTTAHPYGYINITSCNMEVYSSVNLTVGQEICLLKQSGSGVIPPNFCGSINLSDCMIYADASDAGYHCAGIVNGNAVSPLFNIITDASIMREDAVQVIISNCHQVGTESSVCKVTVEVDDVMELSMIYENISHTHYGTTKLFEVSATTLMQEAEILMSKISNCTELTVRGGNDSIISVQGTVNTQVLCFLGNRVSFTASHCTHKKIPATEHLIRFSNVGVDQIIHCTNLHARFISVATGYLVSGGFAIKGGLIATCTQFQGNSDTDFGAPVSTVANYRYT